MSGGSFDYNCHRISQFADDLKEKIDNNQKKDEYGYSYNFSPETIKTLKHCHAIIEKAGKLAHHIEWFYSGDHGEETFTKLVKSDLKT